MYSLNIDVKNPKGNPDVSELKELGVEMVRYTFYDKSPGDTIDPSAADLYRKKAEDLKKAGIGSLVILTYDTYPNRPDPNAHDDAYNAYIDNFARRSGQIAKLLADLKPAFQVWNEPDHPIHPGYVPTLSETVYARMQQRTYEAVKNVDSNLLVVTGGLSQGNPSWLSRVIQKAGGTLHADIVAFHPYGQRPEPNWPDPNWAFGYVGGLINGYYKAGKSHPLWITEMGIKEADLGNDRQKCGEFLRRYYKTIANSYADRVQELMWFCYSDGMVPTFGLKDEALNPKPIYNAFKQAVQERPAPAPKPEPKPTPVTPVPVPTPTPTPLPTTPQPLPTVTPTPTPVTPPASTGAPATQVTQQVTEIKVENAGLKQQIWRMEKQINQLQTQVKEAEQSQTPPPVSAPVLDDATGPDAAGRPNIQNITLQLKHHPSRRFPERPLNHIQRIIIHHTGIPATISAEKIAAYRVDKQGWPAIGYHYLITNSGQIQQTNALTTVTSHAAKYNPVSVGVCFAGDFNKAVPTPAQLDAGGRLIAWLLKQFNLKLNVVSGYNVKPGQPSPGQQWNTGAKWSQQLAQKIQENL